MELWQNVVGILNTPFVGELDISHLFLLIGLALVFIVAWIFILQHIRAAAEAVI